MGKRFWTVVAAIVWGLGVAEAAERGATSVERKNDQIMSRLEQLNGSFGKSELSISALKRGPFEYRLTTARSLTRKITGFALPIDTRPVEGYSGKIVGGTKAGPDEFPWQVALLHPQNGELFCGGTHIGGGWILTAAHCAYDGTGQLLTKDDIVVLFGTTSLLSGGTRVPLVQDPKVNDQWSPPAHHDDIALLKIDDPNTLSAARIALDVVEGAITAPGALLTVSGWGDTSEGGEISTDLLKVDVPVVDLPTCQAAYPSDNVGDQQICAGNNGQDSCQGDSGGPLTGLDDSGKVLVGIVSYGLGCGRPGFPGIYTRVVKYKQWIGGITQ